MHKKAAFTMVELIFVIVILGILAAVAVPKLNASRQDAQLAALKANIRTIFKDLETYYIANGTFGGVDYADKFTNVPLKNGLLNIDSKGDCLLFGASTNNYQLTVAPGKSLDNPVPLHPVCAKALEDPEIKKLFEAYKFDDCEREDVNFTYSPTKGAQKYNAIDYQGIAFLHIMDEGGINFD